MSNEKKLMEKIKEKDLERRLNKIFAIGLPKTGTTSLTLALEKLGYKTFHWPLNYIYQRILSVRPKDWDCCPMEEDYIEQWDALTNFGENIYPLLDDDFPNSKFILTVRDKNKWIDSSERHFNKNVSSIRNIHDGNWSIIPTSSLRRMQIYGCINFDRDIYSNFYDNHYRNVCYYFKDRPKDFMIMNICEGDGWEKLCGFLDRKIPSLNFPHKNKEVGYVK